MIPAPPNMYVEFSYKDENGNPFWKKHRVIAFDGDGSPLFLSARGRLCSGEEYKSTVNNCNGFVVETEDPDDGLLTYKASDGWYFYKQLYGEGKRHRCQILEWIAYRYDLFEKYEEDSPGASGLCGFIYLWPFGYVQRLTMDEHEALKAEDGPFHPVYSPEPKHKVEREESAMSGGNGI